MMRFFKFLVFGSLFYSPYLLYSQSIQETTNIPELFSSEKEMFFFIRANLPEVLADRDSIENYYPAEVIYRLDGKTDTLPCRIRVRGNFRKDTLNCDFPPLRLNFKKGDVRGTVFGPQDNFKLVTHCRTNDSAFSQNVVKEYYVYKIYNQVTPVSLQTRLARVTYQDVSNTLDPITQYAIFIEDDDALAERLNMKVYKKKLSFEELEENCGLLLSYFQYMIGNTDWIVPFAKNLIFIENEEKIYAIPYDFDYCGFVSSDYRNLRGFTILSKPQRSYKGKCYSKTQHQYAAKYFKKLKKPIRKMILESRYLNLGSQEYLISYVNEFYSVIRSGKEFKDQIQKECK